MKMELWIRSQDKECLLKTDIVMLEEIEENKEYWIYAGHELYDPYRVFGVYHTKERALEVLDEIHKYIEKQGANELLVNENGIVNSLIRYGNVYEMPKE